VVHRDHRIEARKVCLGLVVADASAVRDAGRSDAILDLRQAEVRDCPWAMVLDFPWALTALENAPARRDVPQGHPVPQLRDAWRMAACRLVPQTAQAGQFAPAQVL
jgi:hypothetical protein